MYRYMKVTTPRCKLRVDERVLWSAYPAEPLRLLRYSFKDETLDEGLVRYVHLVRFHFNSVKESNRQPDRNGLAGKLQIGKPPRLGFRIVHVLS